MLVRLRPGHITGLHCLLRLCRTRELDLCIRHERDPMLIAHRFFDYETNHCLRRSRHSKHYCSDRIRVQRDCVSLRDQSKRIHVGHVPCSIIRTIGVYAFRTGNGAKLVHVFERHGPDQCDQRRGILEWDYDYARLHRLVREYGRSRAISSDGQMGRVCSEKCVYVMDNLIIL